VFRVYNRKSGKIRAVNGMRAWSAENFCQKVFKFKNPLNGLNTLHTHGLLRVCGSWNPEQKGGCSGLRH
jgi:hypothetical protein